MEQQRSIVNRKSKPLIEQRELIIKGMYLIKHLYIQYLK